MNEYSLLIGGKLVTTGETVNVINPATEEVFTVVPKAGQKELNDAVEAAQAAFKSFRSTTIAQRQTILNKITEKIVANKDKIAPVLTMEQGKPLEMANMEIDYAIMFCRHFASMDIPVEVLIDTDEQRVELHRKPLGVVAGILPWNFPFLLAISKMAPALLAGNAVIIKPAPTTPVTTLMLGEIIKDIVPPGLVNILADNDDLGPHITAHPGIQKISFTGSTETGKKVMANSADTLKRLTLELGGNDAAIVLDDVDPKEMAARIFGAAFMNSGQVCVALKRLYVQEGIYDELCDKMATMANAAVVGDGLSEGSQFGPVQNKAQFNIIKDFIEDAKQNGNIIAGGELPDKPGYFVPLTIVRDIIDGTKLVNEEPFGPILPIIKFKEIDDVLERANGLSYGLGGSVWSKDLDKAYAIAEQMESGTVWINQHCVFGPHIPFPACKESGIGVEWGKEGVYELTALRVINISKI